MTVDGSRILSGWHGLAGEDRAKYFHGPVMETNMNDRERQVLDRFKAALRQRVDAFEIILFGSRARGDADPFSDMDVIVIIEGDADERSRHVVSDCAWEAGFESGIVVVPIVFSRTEWETDASRYSLLGRAVAQEGIAV
jgi:uncharacterized protein